MIFIKGSAHNIPNYASFIGSEHEKRPGSTSSDRRAAPNRLFDHVIVRTRQRHYPRYGLLLKEYDYASLLPPFLRPEVYSFC